MSTNAADPPRLTHIDEDGHASMVNVSEKSPTKRTATAVGRIYIPLLAYQLITLTYDQPIQPNSPIDKSRRKGDALTVAQLAGIMGSKRTSDLIPLCHPLLLTHVQVLLTPEVGDIDGTPCYSVFITASVTCDGKTGVEMEALTAVSVAALTVWDMLKVILINGICDEILRLF